MKTRKDNSESPFPCWAIKENITLYIYDTDTSSAIAPILWYYLQYKDVCSQLDIAPCIVLFGINNITKHNTPTQHWITWNAFCKLKSILLAGAPSINQHSWVYITSKLYYDKSYVSKQLKKLIFEFFYIKYKKINFQTWIKCAKIIINGKLKNF